jgi:arginyl-tRNA synthetase
MLFNPEESIDLNGNTAPFIQYTHARICSLLRKAGVNTLELPTHHIDVIPKAEKEILSMLYEYPATVKQAASELNPSLLANFAYELVKAYNRFYQDTPVLKETNENLRHFRLQLSAFTASVLRKAMNLLGIDLPEKM